MWPAPILPPSRMTTAHPSACATTAGRASPSLGSASSAIIVAGAAAMTIVWTSARWHRSRADGIRSGCERRPKRGSVSQWSRLQSPDLQSPDSRLQSRVEWPVSLCCEIARGKKLGTAHWCSAYFKLRFWLPRWHLFLLKLFHFFIFSLVQLKFQRHYFWFFPPIFLVLIESDSSPWTREERGLPILIKYQNMKTWNNFSNSQCGVWTLYDAADFFLVTGGRWAGGLSFPHVIKVINEIFLDFSIRSFVFCPEISVPPLWWTESVCLELFSLFFLCIYLLLKVLCFFFFPMGSDFYLNQSYFDNFLARVSYLSA